MISRAGRREAVAHGELVEAEREESASPAAVAAGLTLRGAGESASKRAQELARRAAVSLRAEGWKPSAA